MRLGWRVLPGINILDYYQHENIMVVKSFIKLLLVVAGLPLALGETVAVSNSQINYDKIRLIISV
jgi:hypothetical protein